MNYNSGNICIKAIRVTSFFNMWSGIRGGTKGTWMKGQTQFFGGGDKCGGKPNKMVEPCTWIFKNEITTC